MTPLSFIVKTFTIVVLIVLVHILFPHMRERERERERELNKFVKKKTKDHIYSLIENA